MNTPVLRLLADIGGTNARFALQRPGRAPTRYRILATADHPGPRAAISHYLGLFRDAPRPMEAAIAIAGPVTGDAIHLTNTTWSFSRARLRRAAGLERLAVLNDFEALAWAVPALRPPDLRKMGRGRGAPGLPCAVFGPGTGLGVACYLPRAAGGPAVLSSEGGHATMAAQQAREAEVVAVLRARFDHVSAERVLSGPGLTNIYAALTELDGVADAPPIRPGEVAKRAQDGSDARAREAVTMFSTFAGSFAGDIALFYGARGGVYVGGGVILRLGRAFDTRLFRRRFEDKGRFRRWLAPIPTYLIRHPHPTMLGLSRYLDSTGGA